MTTAQLEQTAQEEVNLNDYYTPLSTNELDELEGKEITLKFVDANLKGKIKRTPFSETNGYHFVHRVDAEKIIEIYSIFASDITPGDLFQTCGFLRLHNAKDRQFFLSGRGISVEHHYKGLRIQKYESLDHFLRQGVFDF